VHYGELMIPTPCWVSYGPQARIIGRNVSLVPTTFEDRWQVSAEHLEGFLKGFVDLIFEWRGRYYLADYKSNWLGQSEADYHPLALQRSMLEHAYPLQYALYTLALHRFLRLRLAGYDYERHMGGVYYLFLRGINPQAQPGSGVVAERPGAGFIAELDRLVGGGEHEPV
jgi:exodeoxyribonuclease V beta subunit